jgi:hypothetical protein
MFFFLLEQKKTPNEFGGHCHALLQFDMHNVRFSEQSMMKA